MLVQVCVEFATTSARPYVVEAADTTCAPELPAVAFAIKLQE